MSTKAQQRLSATSLVMLALAFIVAVAISNQLFKGWRLDLTENNLYTLSDGTKNLLRGLDEPINLYFYYSDQATAGTPVLRSYANRVREMLEGFEDAARGNIQLSIIDPLPFSEDEDRAAQFGLQGVRLSAIPDPVYMGLAGTDSVDNEEIIPFFQPDKEAFLEYDIAKLVSTLANPEQNIIGLVSGVDMAGSFDPQTQRMQPPWVVYQQAQQLFDLRDLGTTFNEIADDVSLLWIVQPKRLTNDTLYAIDQFIMRGGKAIIFVDPLAESDPAAVEGMPQGMPPMGQSSDIPALFSAWGLEYSPAEVVADAQIALQISGRDRRPVRHYGFLGVTEDLMSGDDIITAGLNVVNLATAGHFASSEESVAAIEPLLRSSPASQTMAASRFSYLPDPSSLQTGFVASGEQLILAARVTGILPSAFPNGRPPTTVSSDAGDLPTDSAATEHLVESTIPVNLIVVADVDMLGDGLWVRVQDFFGQQIANTFASNGAFVINALENLSGSSDLIGVRSRASFTRPFTRVETIRAEAEASFRETEQRLQSELADTERRLGELQAGRDDTGAILLSAEQQAEIDQFIDQRTAIRQELRAVQRGLDQDIDDLGTVLKAINIGMVPILLALFALFAIWRRNRRQLS
jgi:gliding motility-associatede transport system auxiliary component